MAKLSPATRRKYQLYERSVQAPDAHVAWFVSLYKEIFQKYPRALREDFCGTFRMCAEWVKRNRRNTALGLDIDPEPIRYGMATHYGTLSAEQKRRLTILRQNVLMPTRQKAHVIVACNFSFCIFKQRGTLLQYFRSCLRSLRPDGMVVLEIAGGPGMIEKVRETRRIKKQGEEFTYIWDQKSFNPITHDAAYSIHFRLPNGERITDAFTYDWRLWTIPELREALTEAGFADTLVYWETEHRGKGTGEYVRTDLGDNAYAWIAYVIGKKSL